MSLWTRQEERQITVQKAEGSMHSEHMTSDTESDGFAAVQG